MNPVESARYIIESNNFMTIASADETGKPWASPVGFVYDRDFNFYWVSSNESLHSKNIQHRPEVALSIYGRLPTGGYDGVYIDAVAMELDNDAEIQLGIDLSARQRPQPSRFAATSVADVTGDATWRMYKAVPAEVSKRSDATLRGQAVTVREIITL